MHSVDTWLTQHRGQFESDLFELLRIPSVSAESCRRTDVRRAADWLAERFRQAGLTAEVLATPGHPVVYAESACVAGAPVALVYGHYDVQPADPLDQWTTPPFEPTVRDGNVFARGATDDKGQMLTHVQSVRAWLAAAGKLPLQVKFLIEGEEEIGSPNLQSFLQTHRQRLCCDCLVVSDTSQFRPGLPAITYGLRGIAYYELRLFGPRQDLHSGSFGGAVLNPANVLARLVASLTDERGRVTLPGFYDRVIPLAQRERDQFARLPLTDAELADQIGTTALGGEAGYTSLERRWARPTFDVCGLSSGYQGEGAKTILPAQASAKLSFRLVPRQDPRQVTAALTQHLAARMPAGMKWELVDLHGAPGVVVPLDSPFVAAASRAVEQGFGRAPVLIREGGSLPILNAFQEVLQADALLLGWGQNDDNPHSPNEKFSLADYHRGIATSARLWEELAQVGSTTA